MMLPLKRQKSLLDYATSTSSPSTQHRHRADSTDSDSGEEPSQPKRRPGVSGHVNTVQVDRAQGGTTIIINNSGGHSSNSVNSSPTPIPPPTQPEQLQNTRTLVSEVPSDVAASPNEQPCQPRQAHFPATLIGSKQRAFNPDWYKTYNWLEYSIERDAVFCYPCRLFTVNEGRAQNTFTKIGFRDWKHATGKGGSLVLMTSAHLILVQW